MKDFFNSENFFIKIDSDLSRIKTFSNQNRYFKKIYNSVYSLFEKINNEMLDGKKQINNLETHRENLNKKQFLNFLESIEQNKKNIQEREKEFFNLSKEITNQDNFLRKEMIFYSKHWRNFLNAYKNKRTLLHPISKPIEEIIKEGASIEKDFNISIQSANWKKASSSLKAYLNLVKKLGNIIDKGPTIYAYIYKTIPLKIKELDKTYKRKLKESENSLKNINFDLSLRKIANTFLESKENFNLLEIDKCIEQIKQMLKAIKILERLIITETDSKKLFLEIYEKFQEEKTNVENYYKKQTKEINKLINQGFVFDNLFLKTNLSVKELFINFQNNSKSALKLKETNLIPFSSKVFRLKKIINQTQVLTETFLVQDELIYGANSQKIKLQNLYKQIEFALYDAFYNAKKQKILISREKLGQFKELKKELLSLSKAVYQENINIEIERQLKILLEKVSSFYLEINIKIQITSIIHFLFEDFNPNRALDKRLNNEFVIAEEQYLKGDYINSLNIIINFFEQKGIHG